MQFAALAADIGSMFTLLRGYRRAQALILYWGGPGASWMGFHSCTVAPHIQTKLLFGERL